jgi:hypothetical protein
VKGVPAIIKVRKMFSAAFTGEIQTDLVAKEGNPTSKRGGVNCKGTFASKEAVIAR